MSDKVDLMHSDKAKAKRLKHRTILKRYGFVRVGTSRAWLKVNGGNRKIGKSAPFALNAVINEIARRIVASEKSIADNHNTKTIGSLEASRAFESIPFLNASVAKERIDLRAPLFRYEKGGE